ncbi:MAG: hypothetical protein WC843_02985 [Candidatus Gracilibacteria bacterium]|jgi:hypothetical protein
MAFENAPKDLLVIKKVMEEEVMPAIKEKRYFVAQMEIGNILGGVDQDLVRDEHCGMGLIASLKALEKALKKEKVDQLEGGILRVRAYLAQALMYYR